jgi:hypothetical protein
MFERDEGAAEIPREQLHAVADPQDRQSAGQHARIETGGTRHERRLRSAGKDDRRGTPLFDLAPRRVVRQKLAVDARFARAPRDQLAVLGAEIQDDDGRRTSRNGGHLPPLRRPRSRLRECLPLPARDHPTPLSFSPKLR